MGYGFIPLNPAKDTNKPNEADLINMKLIWKIKGPTAKAGYALRFLVCEGQYENQESCPRKALVVCPKLCLFQLVIDPGDKFKRVFSQHKTLTPNNFIPAYSQFSQLNYEPEKKKHWKEVGMNRGPLNRQLQPLDLGYSGQGLDLL